MNLLDVFPCENKYFDYVNQVTADYNGPYIIPMNALAQGSVSTSRVGAKVNINSFSIRCRFILSNTFISGTPRTVNFASACGTVSLVLDKQPNGLLPNVPDLFNAPGVNGMINMEKSDRFTILWEHLFDTPVNFVAGGTTAPGVNNFFSCGETMIKYFMPLDIDTIYSDAAPFVSSIATNALYVICRSSNETDNSGLYNPWLRTDFCVSARIRFRDC